jgi:hypothetical protein
MQQSTSKRKRGDEYLDANATFNSELSSSSLSLSALGGGGGGGGGGPSGSASGSFLGSSSLGATGSTKSCNVPSHSRLESIVKQTELLRRMDADAHAVLRAEATEIREKLEIQVSALEAQLAAVKARGISVSSASTSSSLQRPQAAEAVLNDEIDLTADSDSEAVNSSSNALIGGESEVLQCREEIKELKRLLAFERKMNADESASHQRALAAADAALHRASSSSSLSSSSSSSLIAAKAATFIQPSLPANLESSSGSIINGESELAEARESLRASQRRERALTEEVKRLQQQHASSTILTEKLTECQKKLSIAEKEAANASTLRSNLSSAMAALAQWDSTVWSVLAQNDNKQLPPPSGGNDASSTGDLTSTISSFSTVIADSASHSSQVREAVIELQSAHRLLLATVSEQKARLEAASKGRDTLTERQMSLIRENSKLIASNANAISERDTAKKEALNLSSHCERLKALIKHYETDGKAGTITRQAVQALDEQAKSLANAVIELNTLNATTSTQSGQGGRGGGGRQILASNVSAQLTALQKSLQETSQFTANSIRASNESAEALKARCDLLERSASDLQAQLVAALEATSTLKLVPSIVADAALEGQRLAEEECAQLEQELKALYVQTMPRVGGGGGVGVNKNNSTHETFADGTSTSSYRVLHLISNPTSTAVREADAKQRQMLDALKLEAKNLREQLAAELRKVASSSIALRAMQSQLASAEREKNELQKAFSNLRENASALVSATPILSPILSTTLMAQEQQGHINAVAIAADSAVAASVSTPTPVAAAQTVDFEKYKTQLLKSVTEKIHKFKDAVKVLTGWQFGITDTERTSSGGILNRFVLTSLFAEAEHDTLVFVQEISANGAVGDINLASSPYAERIPKDILAVLKLTNSYPAFLAAITSDAVARSTVS